MWSALRGGALSSSHYAVAHRWKNLPSSHPIFSRYLSSSAVSGVEKNKELLSLSEVEKILHDVRADDVKVISSPKGCEFADYIVIATGRSPWHVRNISQALIYKAGSLAPIPATRACGFSLCGCYHAAHFFYPLKWADDSRLYCEYWWYLIYGPWNGSKMELRW